MLRSSWGNDLSGRVREGRREGQCSFQSKPKPNISSKKKVCYFRYLTGECLKRKDASYVRLFSHIFPVNTQHCIAASGLRCPRTQKEHVQYRFSKNLTGGDESGITCAGSESRPPSPHEPHGLAALPHVDAAAAAAKEVMRLTRVDR